MHHRHGLASICKSHSKSIKRIIFIVGITKCQIVRIFTENRILCMSENHFCLLFVVELHSRRVYFHNVFVRLVLKEEEELGSSSNYSLVYINHDLAS